MNSTQKKIRVPTNRHRASATDFTIGVQSALEKHLKCTISSIAETENNAIDQHLDHNGIVAFRYDQSGTVSTLASRMNYQRAVATRPMFSFRYALWNAQFKAWDCDREYIRKLLILRQPTIFKLLPSDLLPTIHVESFCHGRNTGKIGWSFAASTKEILEFAEMNLDNREIVEIYEPRDDQRRKVIKVSVAAFAKAHSVMDLTR